MYEPLEKQFKEEIAEKEGRQQDFAIRYSYEWKRDVPEYERNTQEHPSRTFCIELMESHRLYTRAEIDGMSQQLGYSVWEQCGGDGCRHRWVSHVINLPK